MSEFSSPEEIAERLAISPKTVREWLRAGELVGIKVGKSWRIHDLDLARLLDEQLFNARLARAQKIHPDLEWTRGQCRECGMLMPEPRKFHNPHWVCSAKCRDAYDDKAAAITGRGTEEFADCAGTVVPPY
ncbi:MULTISPECIES: helix-turn-helix domain-containing protein [unclassified Azospirillum]|uniref:helix-turn-helix domain-containing protein n=1 Tax=unclassified Azospirillum TaxID=2630922 RepID=UPI000B74EA07|nr:MULTISPECIES: helix-turn-helix domain-containing protein [unclassified Azospirillum]SNT21583.1 DNA binding domain-containing protein, excisionase family [Azospirillum sp. RU38E]SNT33152.1 DNA binding domain-containing protein, excisionase family [Azospirillum sp. RU37A]